MNSTANSVERLRFLTRVVVREVALLQESSAGLFAVPEGAGWSLPEGELPAALAERMDAFVARFARLQDTLGDKLLPALLEALDEPVGAMIDNLNRAERLLWLDSVEAWRSVRALRNQMIHDYVEDRLVLSAALVAARDAVPMLCETAARMCQEVARRLVSTA